MARRARTAVPAPAPTDLRARDQDRDRCVEQLQSAYVDGALTHEELDDRLHAALSARTLHPLAALVRDLPVGTPRPEHPARPSRPHRLVLSVAATGVALLGIVGVATATSSPPTYEGEAVCVSTGRAETDCPALTKQQVAIQRSAGEAAEAAGRAESAAEGSADGTPVARAAARAQQAARRAGRAERAAEDVVAAVPDPGARRAALTELARRADRAAAASNREAERAEKLSGG